MASNITFTSSLKSRLMLMAAIPALALLYFSGSGVVERLAVSKEMVQLESLVDVSVKIGALVHEMQKERGMSASFISSNGAKFSAELPAQRTRTDKAIETLQTRLNRFDAGIYSDGLKTLLDSATANLAELAAKRGGISALGLEVAQSSAYYTKTIASLLDISAQVSTLSSHSEISRLASSYSSLLKAKERTGMERALLVATFGSDQFTPDAHSRFLKNFSAQDVYTDLFFAYALDSQKAFYKAKVSGPAVDEVARMEKIAMDKSNGFGIDPLYWFKTVTEKIDLIKEVEDRLSGDLLDAASKFKSEAERTAVFFIALTVLSVLATVALTFFISREILRSINALRQVAGAIASGDLSSSIDLSQKDELGELFRSMDSMQQQLLSRITKEHREHNEALRLKIALDGMTSNVMVADNEGNIIYLNPAVLTMMQHAESDIRMVLPKFDSGKLLGANMDSFHKNPAHQKKLLGALTSTFNSEIIIGRRTFNLITNPISNEQGRRIGTVVEWQDRTAEVAIEQEIAKVVSGAVLGDFNQRIDEGDKEGFFLELAEGVNELMEVSSTGLNEVVRVLGALSRGDLTQTITNNYSGTFGQLKDDSNSTVEKLKEIVGQIKEASETINTAAKEIAAGNNDLSHRTEEQAASLEQTAASMEELTSTVQANSQNAKHANRLAVGATDIAGQGVKVVGQVVSTMEDINESSRRVVDIISVIDSIAFQTNILALNAAVEAARAGEQGRGFAVVAVEVRNLAQRAAAAAAEIKGLIGDSVEKVEDGTKLVAQAGLTMEEIVSAIRGVTVIMSEISAASMEQTSGIEQVNQAIGQMDDVTQQNAALVEQAAAAAESLEEQTQQLAVTVSHFKLDGNSRGFIGFANTEPARTVNQTGIKSAPVEKESYQNTPASDNIGIDLDKALEKHSEWKVKLRAAISKREEMDATIISRDDCCDFGKWLHHDVKHHLAHKPSYADCVSKHAAFHIEAGRIANMINAKKFREAETMLGNGSAFVSASTAVGVAIMRLKKDFNSPVSAVAKPKSQATIASADEWEEF
ncbi:methyl-accepting chemotaxis protein [Methylobacter tundripaludum]|uniref:Methyl-accepting chemotaxis protein n=1 Tax=Methylobacter tundripaludum TaxID=173365 RepID=A0A2S6H7U6_9GAMM|nr:nitrate- and nitrite sensing domain-containing protein [Methylobacter tundripaludum]PPK73562.1 methyl-accepting chemotaxis protein [Methylobacter tundripaludum]